MNALWYKNPAEDERSAFPVGNGRLGALVYGRPDHEIIILNEESIWSGPFIDRNNGENKKSPSLRNSCGRPFWQTFYQSAGSFCIDFYNPEKDEVFGLPSDYMRRLDFETGVASLSFSKEVSLPSTADFSSNTRSSSVTYTRDVFASAASDVIVVHIGASIPKSINFSAYFDRGPFMSKVYNLSDDTIVMQDTHGIPFAALATAVAYGGSVSASPSGLSVEGADEVTIFIDIQTAYRRRHYFRKAGNVHKNLNSLASLCSDTALKNVCFASSSPYADVYENHVTEYSENFSKCSLSLSSSDDKEAPLPTDMFFEKKTKVPAFWDLYWNFCHYLLISACGRRGSLPAGSSGLWSCDMLSNNGGRINVPSSLLLLEKSLGWNIDKWLTQLCRHGRETARIMYGIEGLACHNSLDLWADTVFNGSINDAVAEGISPVSFAYISLLIRRYFDLTKDYKFLKKYYNLLMLDSCRFFAKYKGELTADESELVAKARTACVKSAEDLNLKAEFESSGQSYGDESYFVQAKLSDSPEFYAGDFEKCLGDLEAMNSSLLQSSILYDNGEEFVKINILPSLPSAWQRGSLKGMNIKGNLIFDMTWEDKKLTSAKIYTKEGSKYTKKVEIIYQGKAYRAPLSEGKLDVFNVLPSTLK